MKKIIFTLLFSLSLSVLAQNAILSKQEIKLSYQNAVKEDKKNEKEAQKGSLNQHQLNQLSAQNFELWDRELNKIWAYLRATLPRERMEALTVKQRKWIKQRDDYAQKQAKDWQGGSGYSMIYNSALAEKTQERVEQLLKLVEGKKNQNTKSKKTVAKTKGDIFKAYGNLIDEDAKIQRKIRGENLEGVIKLSKKQYDLWDKHLNLVWKYLKKNYPQNEMDFLTNKQRDWVQYKENLAKQRASNADNYNLAYYMTLTEETKKKVEELMELLK